jgi:hypothetical protein
MIIALRNTKHTLQTLESRVVDYSNLQRENLGNATIGWDLGMEIITF